MSIAGSCALEVVDLLAVSILAVVVCEERVVVLVHAKVDHVSPVLHVQTLVTISADIFTRLTPRRLAQLPGLVLTPVHSSVVTMFSFLWT